MNAIVQTGVFLQARQYKFVDKGTGEELQGTTLHLGVEPEERDRASIRGWNLNKLSADYAFFSKIPPGLEGKMVEVECEMSLRGRNVRLRPIAIRVAKSEASKAA